MEFGAENCFCTSPSDNAHVAMLDATHFVVAYTDYMAQRGIAIVGSIDNGVITYGATSVFNTSETYNMSIAAIDSNRFVVSYGDGGNSYYGTARVGEVSGTTITSYGAENVFGTLAAIDIDVAMLDDTHFVVAFIDNNDSSGVAVVGEISGTTITSYGANNTFNNTGITTYTSVAMLDSSRFVVSYGVSGVGTAIVGAVSGNTITSYGSVNVFNSSNTGCISVAALDATHFVVAYRDYGNGERGTAIVGVVSDTTISSYGAESVFSPGSAYYTSTASFGENGFVVAFSDHTNSDRCTSVVGEVSGTTITSYEPVIAVSSIGIGHVDIAIFDTHGCAIAYKTTSWSSCAVAMDYPFVVIELSTSVSISTSVSDATATMDCDTSDVINTVPDTTQIDFENIYPGHDNVIDLYLVDDGIATDISELSRVTVEFDDTIIDSDTSPNAFNWTDGGDDGIIYLSFGDESIPVGSYNAVITIYDADNTSGFVWGDFKCRVIDYEGD